jgi:N-acetylneuraminic acid mutarotase
VNSRTEATLVLLQRGWVELPGVGTAPAAEVALEPSPLLEPLSDLDATPAPWQRATLLIALLIGLSAVFLPGFLSRPGATTSLLSDAGITNLGRPTIELLPRWDALTPLTIPRSRLAVTRMGDMLYVVGGEGRDGNTLDLFESYDLNVNRWRTLPSLPQPVANAAATTLNDAIYVAGGSMRATRNSTVQQLHDKLLRYSPGEGRWTVAATLPYPLAGASLVAYRDALYLVGGWDGTEMHDEVWRLTPTSSHTNWELVSRLPASKAFMGATVVGDEIYVVGGFDGQRELADATVLNLQSLEWRWLPPLNTARGGLSLIFDSIGILALGGGWTRAVSTHERYDPFTNQWTIFSSPIQGEWRHLAAAERDGHVFIFGGWSGDYLDTHLQYQSTFRTMLPIITTD